jgi:Zn-dependent M28 family amino/carboxypeptidase
VKIQFGRESIAFGEEASRSAAAAAPREQLHVVVQNGRLFQQHHPDVPVLHDRGRFLLVQLDAKQARALSKGNETCFGIMPAADVPVVFEEPVARAARAPAAFAQTLVDRAKRESIEITLKQLVAFGTRHSLSEGFAKAATAMRQQLKDLGYVTRTQTVPVSGKNSQNVIADRAGSGSGKRNVILATAHLDSINIQGGPAAPAPGADDNGSGSAGLLEIARVFHDHPGTHDLRLILFGGEEEGLFGSKRYVASLTAAERKRITGVVNMDMIATRNASPSSVLLEGAQLSQSVIDKLASSAQTFTQLKVEVSLHPFASDHVPFIDAKVPAVLTIEGADNANSNIHSARDTIEKIDFDLALEIVRMNVGFIAGELGKS